MEEDEGRKKYKKYRAMIEYQNTFKYKSFGEYFGGKKDKLVHQFEQLSNTYKESDLFKDIVIFINGYTSPSAQELKHLFSKYGGVFETYPSSRVTHIIATNLPQSTIKRLKGIRDEKIVKPDWIMESIKQNQLLPWQNFQLHSFAVQSQPLISSFITPSSSLSDKRQNNINNNNNKQESEIIEESEAINYLIDSDLLINNNNDVDEANNNLISSREIHSTNNEEVDDGIDESNGDNIEEMNLQIRQHPFTINQNNFQPTNEPISDLNNTHIIDPIDFDPSINLNEEKTTLNNNNNNEYIDNENKIQLKKMQENNCNQPNFLQNYYKNSRLHHLSLWKSQFIEQLLTEFAQSFQLKSAQIITEKRIIMHIDMDCFFASVAIRFNPSLYNKPVVVCHSDTSGGSADIASANYVARSFGIRNGMWIGKAKELCPHLEVVGYQFKSYENISRILFRILLSYSSKLQIMSCDEGYIELNESEKPIEIANEIRNKIYEQTGCTASIGIGPNILLSRLATKKAKPNGVFSLLQSSTEIQKYLKDIEVTELPGIGRSLASKMKSLYIYHCSDLWSFTPAELQKHFGEKRGKLLCNYSRGVDDRRLKNKFRKTIGADCNWGIRMEENDQLDSFLSQLAQELSARLQKVSAKGTFLTLKLKVRHKDASFETAKYLGHGWATNLSSSTSFPSATNDPSLILQSVKLIYKKLSLQQSLKISDLRGIGIHMSHLIRPNIPNNSSDSSDEEEEDFDHPKKKQKEVTISQMFRKIQSKKSTNVDVLFQSHVQNQPPKSILKHTTDHSKVNNASNIHPKVNFNINNSTHNQQTNLNVIDNVNNLNDNNTDKNVDNNTYEIIDNNDENELNDDFVDFISINQTKTREVKTTKETSKKRKQPNNNKFTKRTKVDETIENTNIVLNNTTNNDLPYRASEIDLNVLKELPIYYQREIKSNYAINSPTKIQKRSKKIADQFVNKSNNSTNQLNYTSDIVNRKLKGNFIEEVENEEETTNINNKLAIEPQVITLATTRTEIIEQFSSFNIADNYQIFRPLFLEFMGKLTSNSQSDISLLLTIFSSKVLHKLDELVLLFRLLKKYCDLSKEWCRVFNHIETQIQLQMIEKYGSTLDYT